MYSTHSADAVSSIADLHLKISELEVQLANRLADNDMLRQTTVAHQDRNAAFLNALQEMGKSRKNAAKDLREVLQDLKRSQKVAKGLLQVLVHHKLHAEYNAGGASAEELPPRQNAGAHSLEELEKSPKCSCRDGVFRLDSVSSTTRTLFLALLIVRGGPTGRLSTSLGGLLQFAYGEDGAFIEKQNIDIFALNDEEFRHDYRVDVTDEKGGFMPGVLQVGLDDSSLDLQAKLRRRVCPTLRGPPAAPHLHLPSRPTPRPVSTSPSTSSVSSRTRRKSFRSDRRQPRDLEPAYIIDAVRELGERLVVVRGEDAMSKVANDDAVLRFRMHLRFATRRVLERFHLTRGVLGEVESKSNQSVVNPGEMCGTPAAQSIGEPATQMTLTTFHYAGVSSKNVTPGMSKSNPVLDDGMLIENGELVFGTVEKTIGASQLFTGLQIVVNYWLFHNGFSIGIGDTIAD
ncbi:DNA-directed RNA polymerase subunit [Mycena kentingensis (nom. inval.)]|nr:DNA-directed RNA polymerase subunit [Mycena kentingensis (nom. inval.)]